MVPREVCAKCSERNNRYCEITLNAQKSAEAIVPGRERAESIGVLSTTRKGGVSKFSHRLSVSARQLLKPPCTERYARWCERTAVNHRLLLDLKEFSRYTVVGITWKFIPASTGSFAAAGPPYGDIDRLWPSVLQEPLLPLPCRWPGQQSYLPLPRCASCGR